MKGAGLCENSGRASVPIIGTDAEDRILSTLTFRGAADLDFIYTNFSRRRDLDFIYTHFSRRRDLDFYLH